jgi:hypothetical protein
MGLEQRWLLFRSAIDLNAKAIDECRKALNTIDFLRRYQGPKPLGRNRIPNKH